MTTDRYIVVHNARENNLKNVDVTIPHDKLVVFTGVSGSGKSSLAFDTIFTEAQRRYLQSLSAYARQFIGDLQKPDVDKIEGLSPSISIEQKPVSQNPRSIVATVTEIYDYFRLLYANIGIRHCPICGKKINPKSSQEITDEILKSLEEGTKFKILAPIIRGKKGTYEKLFQKLQKLGFTRVIVQDEGHEPIEHLIEDKISLDKNRKHTIEVVVDRLIFRTKKKDFRSRLANAVETSLEQSEGFVTIAIVDGPKRTFSEYNFCTDCGVSYGKLLPRDFSFNTPYGMCKYCKGLGSMEAFDEDKVFPDRNVSLYDSGLRNVGGFGTLGTYSWQLIEAVADHYEIDLTEEIQDLPPKFWDVLMIGSGTEKIEFSVDRSKNNSKSGNDNGISWRINRPFEGILNTLQRRYQQTSSQSSREYYTQFMTEYKCNKCHGQRLKQESLAVKVNGKNIWQVCEMSVKDAMKWFDKLKLTKREKKIAKEVLKEIDARYRFLNNVGLDYITLDRLARTLSGGESERIRLATQIGSNLVGVLYVLDEPTIGLHCRDKIKLITMLKELRDKGNTVLIVEHDDDVMINADHIVDLGPLAGTHGGEIVAEGTLEDIKKNPKSLTGQYMNGTKFIEIPKVRRKMQDTFVIIKGASKNNLKKVDVKIPLGVFTCITGVSGAGKSSLIEDVLLEAVEDTLRGRRLNSDDYVSIEGLEHIDKVINIDQSPIGRTPKSVPGTYTKSFDHIRNLFARTEEAKIRGYKKGRFSFNVKGGRCEKCRGRGFNLIEMHFLPDVYVKCDVCKGRRYNDETLEVKYKEKTISDVLHMTHNEALEFFKNHRKIKDIVNTVVDVGLGYIELGQPSPTLSGGEAQRMKLSRELSKRSTGNTLYILDEPTTGLHFHDVKYLIEVLKRLVDGGNTAVVIEHNMDIIKSADHIIDLGPEGGDKGGNVVITGTPEDIARCDESYTGYYLKKVLVAAGNGKDIPQKKTKKVKMKS